jgi:hypothetical protein
MTKSFVLKLLLLIAVATVAVTAFAQPSAPRAHSARAGKNDFITATFDFRAGAFTGHDFWLGVDVCPAGSNALTDLSVPPAANPANPPMQ